MPPRGRPRKRLGRMDAAVDAMAPLGFDECLVKKTVYRLLKLYGGDEWWPVIEEYGYKELIEAILAHQEEEQTQGVSSPDERAEDPDLGRTIGPSGTLVDSTCNERSAIGLPSGTLVNSTCNEAGNTVGEIACYELVNAVGEPTHEELCSNKQDIGSSEVFCLPTSEGGRNRWKDIGEDRPSIKKGMANDACSDGGNSVNPGIKNLSPPADHRPTTLPSSKPVSTQPPRRCFPCYGWIEDDEKDADDFIQLTPMKLTTPLQSQKSSGGTSKCMKRKSRWDITPYDL
ncbi:hypothetical protein K7X08_034655 [Anisodus acutangulus]|uniref:WIYLD domain-containing protein n=1 Tax=Anisodus acutangulus TaxID=402998 RepID=A0A9Q1LJP4_9SOLA|nr:hypothetical protein K7X08_034655 [Anisodus acutangulus]